jgi:short-subunit dehydrogenase
MAESNAKPRRPLDQKGRALVIGASSGLGAALVRKLVAAGYEVAALARRDNALEEVCRAANEQGEGLATYFTHDVTDTEAIPTLFQEITRTLGGLDLVIYVAGYMPPVQAQEYDYDKDSEMIAVNLLGAMAWLNQAAVRFYQARGGHIVGIGSVSGDRGRRAMPAYHASKAALHTYLESLRNRLSQHGVTVTTIKPGQIDTPMLQNTPRRMWPVSAESAAEAIVKAIEDGRGTVYVPARWALVSLVIRHLPSVIFRRLNF